MAQSSFNNSSMDCHTLLNRNATSDPINYANITSIGLDDDLDPDYNLASFDNNMPYYFLENAFNDLIIRDNLQLNIKILHVNIRSYSKNHASLWQYLDNLESKFHIIAFTETWTTPNTEDQLFHPGYKTYAKSRLTGQGGGVAIFVNESIQSNLFDQLPNNLCSFESIFVQITNPSSKPILIGSLYRPPDGDLDLFLNELENTMTILNRLRFTTYLCGDYNLNLLNIDSHNKTNDFLNLMATFLFRPLIQAPTRITHSSSTLIDNIFTNSLTSKECPGILLTDISDHLPIFTIFTIIATIPNNLGKSKYVTYRPKPINALTDLTNDLINEDWTETLSLEDPDHILSSFNTKIYALYNKNYPLTTKKARIYKTKLKPWMSPSLIKSCKTKNKLYKIYLQSKSNIALDKYKQYKNKLTNILRKCEKSYYTNMLELHKNNLRETWKLLKTVLNHHTTNYTNIPLKINGILVDDTTMVVNEFNTYFANIGPKMAATVSPTNLRYTEFLTNPNPNTMFLNPITAEEINNIIINLKDTKPYDHYEMPIEIIKKISHIISEPLTHLFNQSFVTGIFPTVMKQAIISPIYKSGDCYDLANYRPISKLTCYSKILERAMYNRLSNFLENNDLLYNKQFGFRKNHSTSYAIMEVVDKITEAIDKRQITIGVFLDLSKAFDTIKHDILINKLEYYGVRGIPLDWFKSYLTNRTQRVRLGDTLSNVASILCGVPQGSILGPLLFLIYINDITYCSNKLLMYLFADDTTVFITASNYYNLIDEMNEELQKLTDWFCANLLSLNIKKTNYMIFSGPNKKIESNLNHNIIINNKPIDRVPQVKFLGIIIDEHLTWHSHIFLVKNKVAKAIGIIKKLKVILPNRTLKTLYNTLLLPHLNYGTSIWGGGYKTSLMPILLLQKKVIRIIEGLHYQAKTAETFKKLNILTIFNLYKFQVFTFMYQSHNNSLPKIFNNYFTVNTNIHNHYTRSSQNLHLIQYRTNVRSFSIRMAGPRLWNSIDIATRECKTIHSFKKAVKLKLLDGQNSDEH